MRVLRYRAQELCCNESESERLLLSLTLPRRCVSPAEPCAPYGVLTRVECDADTATVSWESSQGALSYVVNMDGRNGHSLSCHTFTTSCTLDGVHCGTVYYASVVALGDRQNSSGFNTVVMASGGGSHTAGAPPQDSFLCLTEFFLP